MNSKEEARRWVIDGETACLPKGCPQPFDVISAKFVKKHVAIAEVVMFDGLSGTLEVSQHNLSGCPSWSLRWIDLPGGAIECRDGVQWVRVEKAPLPVQIVRINQGVLF